MAEKIEVAILGLIVIILLVVVIISGVFSDKAGPVITFENSSELVYKEGQDEAILLEGVKAVDKKDGDVSDTIRVDSIIREKDVIKVKYAAKDLNNNITVSNEYREIKYIQSSSSEEKDTTVSDEKNSEENSSSLGNNDEQNETTASQTDPTEEIDKKKADETGIPVIVLTKKEETINVGESFSNNKALNYVKETYDNSGDVSTRIRISGNNKAFTKAGDYEIKFTVSDTEGNVSEPAILILHVKSGQ